VNANDAFLRAAEEHREAVATCASAIRAVGEESWNLSAEAAKWSPAQIAEHLAVAYEPLLSELDGGAGFRPRAPWWMRPILRWTFLPRILAGRFPTGVRAPSEVRPVATSRGPREGAQRLKERSEVFLDRLSRERQNRRPHFTHPYMGRLSDVEALRFLTSHAHHHRRQLPGSLGYVAGHDPETERE
jgi:uncharacterized damage-inducible protein DinB